MALSNTSALQRQLQAAAYVLNLQVPVLKFSCVEYICRRSRTKPMSGKTVRERRRAMGRNWSCYDLAFSHLPVQLVRAVIDVSEGSLKALNYRESAS
jgi:hypothetical protein